MGAHDAYASLVGKGAYSGLGHFDASFYLYTDSLGLDGVAPLYSCAADFDVLQRMC